MPEYGVELDRLAGEDVSTEVDRLAGEDVEDPVEMAYEDMIEDPELPEWVLEEEECMEDTVASYHESISKKSVTLIDLTGPTPVESEMNFFNFDVAKTAQAVRLCKDNDSFAVGPVTRNLKELDRMILEPDYKPRLFWHMGDTENSGPISADDFFRLYGIE